MIFALPSINHDRSGFNALTHLWNKIKDCFLDDIEIDMSDVTWFAADMCAPFGAILYRLGENINSVKLSGLNSAIETILQRNGFLSTYGGKKLPDRFGTTIPYQRLDVKDDRFFYNYVEHELMVRTEMPEMSPGLLKKFQENIFEIFSNAVLHSKTEYGIFTCGQYFHKSDHLVFSVADMGIGIRQNIKDTIGLDLPADAAINWATQGHNTTRRGPIPGGLGLKLLSEFIDLNGGCIQIVSDTGYWRRELGKTVKNNFPNPFPGTVVTIDINSADTNSYVLASEREEDDIF